MRPGATTARWPHGPGRLVRSGPFTGHAAAGGSRPDVHVGLAGPTACRRSSRRWPKLECGRWGTSLRFPPESAAKARLPPVGASPCPVFRPSALAAPGPARPPKCGRTPPRAVACQSWAGVECGGAQAPQEYKLHRRYGCAVQFNLLLSRPLPDSVLPTAAPSGGSGRDRSVDVSQIFWRSDEQ